MHADFSMVVFGYDRADTASANWIWRAGSSGYPVSTVSVKYSDLSEGRCDACEIVIVGTKADIDALGIDVDQEIRIFIRGESESSQSLRYYGYIKEIDKGVGTHDRMKRTLIIGGLMEQLDEVLAYRYYNDCFIGMGAGPNGGIVENLLTDVIIGESNVNVVNSFTEIDTVDTLISTTDFPDVPVAEAIARLAITEGDIIYGVNERAKLYFKKRPAHPPIYAHTFQIGQDGVKIIQLNKSNHNVKTFYVVRCKTLMAGGELAFEVIDDRLASDPDIRIRMEAVNTPEYSDNTGAIDYGEALIEQNRDPSEPIRLELADFSDQMWAYENINLKDEYGVSFGSFPIKALHWDITSMKCALSVELKEIEPELSSQARLLLRLQRIGAAREFSNNIELIGERYSWLIVTRRAYANEFQTRNFWGAQTDDDETMDLPDPNTVSDEEYPVFEIGTKAVCGAPIPKDSTGAFLDETMIESEIIEVGIERDHIALGIDSEFREIKWTQNEFNAYCRIQNLGGNTPSFRKNAVVYPTDWAGVYGASDGDSILWYEAVMNPWTNPSIRFHHLRNLGNSGSVPANERFHIYWDANIDIENYPPEDNCYRAEFRNNGGGGTGTLEFRVYEEHLGVTTQKYFDSTSMASIQGWRINKIEINKRAGLFELETQVKVYGWGGTAWVEIFDSGLLTFSYRLSRSFWGARWEMNSSTWYGPASVHLRNAYFTGLLPLMGISKDEGENWRTCGAGIFTDISALPAVGTSLKMRMGITHYNLVKGWCMAFK
jgi:hypothetical protein